MLNKKYIMYQVIQNDLFIRYLEVTNNLWRGRFFTIHPKKGTQNCQVCEIFLPIPFYPPTHSGHLQQVSTGSTAIRPAGNKGSLDLTIRPCLMNTSWKLTYCWWFRMLTSWGWYFKSVVYPLYLQGLSAPSFRVVKPRRISNEPSTVLP